MDLAILFYFLPVSKKGTLYEQGNNSINEQTRDKYNKNYWKIHKIIVNLIKNFK